MTRFNLNSLLHKIHPFLILSVPFLLFMLTTQLKFNLYVDENLGHLETIEKFASTFPRLDLMDYPASSGPLSFILWAIFGKVVGFEIWKLRVLTILISYLGSLIFFKTCQDQKIPFPLLKTLCLIFFPYIFLHSFTLYTINLTLFWELLSLRSFLRYAESQSKIDLACGSLGSLALVFSRQIDVALPVGVLCFCLTERRLRELWSLLGSMVPIVGLFLLVLHWNGIAPQKAHQEAFSLSFKLTQLTLLFTVVGFYFQPIGIYQGVKLGRRAGFFLLMVPFLLLFAVPYPKQGLGIVYYGIDLVGKTLHHGSSLVLPLCFGMLGGLVFYGLSKGIHESGRPSLTVYVLFSYVLFNCLNPVVYERYYYFAWPMIILLLPRDVSENRFLSILVLTIHIGISIFYVKLSLVFPK
jgi:hypothetical protein